jgi:hypothetical protein
MSLPKERAHWNEVEINELVDFLHGKRSEVGDGGNFRAKIYNATADHIASHLTQGPKKTGKMCKTKWISVCYHH